MIRNISIAVVFIAASVAMTPEFSHAQLSVADPATIESEFTGQFSLHGQ
ncbi:MAG: hypothetical protein ABFS37_09570 [Acidobacteriota bacterium]